MPEQGRKCAKCKKNKIDIIRTRTKITFGNYRLAQLPVIFAKDEILLCESCSNKLKKWLNE